MTNSLGDLNEHLFAALNRLRDDALDDDAMAREVERSRAVVSVADQIVATASLQLNAAKLFAAHGAQVLPMLPQIGQAADGDGK